MMDEGRHDGPPSDLEKPENVGAFIGADEHAPRRRKLDQRTVVGIPRAFAGEGLEVLPVHHLVEEQVGCVAHPDGRQTGGNPLVGEPSPRPLEIQNQRRPAAEEEQIAADSRRPLFGRAWRHHPERRVREDVHESAHLALHVIEGHVVVVEPLAEDPSFLEPP